ncbi:MAG TPA: DUF6011 domain-containing protein [Verrucomicrobiae bacterium]|jgi:hypothetical protein|nr:DUF6011 domain-containing protein [Verrucomicrobiae bacterium]
MSTMLDRDVIALNASLKKLNPSDQKFANSLLDQAETRRDGLSVNQMMWVRKLLDKAQAAEMPAAPVTSSTVINMAGIIKLLNTAKFNGLARPKIFIGNATEEYRLTFAGAQARFPGSINVTGKNPELGGYNFYGRIHLDGRWEPSNKFLGHAQKIADMLQRLADNPVEQAQTFGRRTGICMFCHIELTDPRSVAVGYGPICAEHYGLPYGE